MSDLCNYICCPEIEDLGNGDFHSNPGNITPKLSLLLVMKSKSRYISKKSFKSCSNSSRRIQLLSVNKGNGFFEISCFSLAFLYACMNCVVMSEEGNEMYQLRRFAHHNAF